MPAAQIFEHGFFDVLRESSLRAAVEVDLLPENRESVAEFSNAFYQTTSFRTLHLYQRNVTGGGQCQVGAKIPPGAGECQD